MAPRTARAVDLAIGQRLAGPIFLGADGTRMDRHGAGRVVRRVARRAGIDKPIGRTPSGTRSLRRPWTPASHSATSKRRRRTPTPRTTMRYDRARVSLDRHATYIVATFIAGASR